EAGKKYLEELKGRRKDELRMLTYLTGKGYDDWDVVVRAEEEKYIPAADSYAVLAKQKQPVGNGHSLLAGIGLLGLLSVIVLSTRTRKATAASTPPSNT